MRFPGIMLACSMGVLFWGCSSGSSPTSSQTAATTPPSMPPQTPPPTTPAPQAVNVAGNWQFTADPSAPGALPLAIAGGLGQSGTEVTGAVHVEGSKCFDMAVPVGIGGDVSAATPSLKLATVNGQVITLTGSFMNATFTGTYKIDGGCADGAGGVMTGVNVALANASSGISVLRGIFTGSAAKPFTVTGDIDQGSTATSEGSFEVMGKTSFTDTPCFTAGTIKPGSFPFGSYVLGMTVALELDTANGTLMFHGMLNPNSRDISGTYTITGGSCNDSGTAMLGVYSVWDY